MHFGMYVKYSIYDWMKSVFCCELDWKDCQTIEETREEAIEQIDVQHLLRRINHV